MTNWSNLLDPFGRALLKRLGTDPDNLPTNRNPITQALRNPGFVTAIENMDGFNRRALARVATVCQMSVFDAAGGPEGDNQPKALRRHWYAWWKPYFAQPFALQLGDFETNAQGVQEIKDQNWVQMLSQIYGEFVDTCMVTYQDLWVEDASRMMQDFHTVLFKGCHIIIAVEKDSLFSDFLAPAQALGAKAVYSGKGKSSKAGIERLLRDHFGWTEHNQPFTPARPLIVLHISDYDYDGETVIGPTFGTQARRYADDVREARVGIQPMHVTDEGLSLPDKWYRVKVGNRAYMEWATFKALHLAECFEESCGARWPVVGNAAGYCPTCSSANCGVYLGKGIPHHGLEVEALRTRVYYGLLVDALLQVLPFDFIVGRLRDECIADYISAAIRVQGDVLAGNDSYKKLLEEFIRLNVIKKEFEERVQSTLEETGKPHVSDWRDLEDDPTPGVYREYVSKAQKGTSVWRPFKRGKRTAQLVQWLRENAKDTLDALKKEAIEWKTNTDSS